ncbi:hypothetical protein Agub_g13755 [Astrephomene gubernaculifera]|uniref:Uncharacterized protein n=1 Tax=Astrephomene gubernaculifera TaxID=47775 RepID=A0AAD3E2W5_9CHLO|nr:hypothetical protein Agub_g13755 [Astrephomene gubernaculifera]
MVDSVSLLSLLLSCVSLAWNVYNWLTERKQLQSSNKASVYRDYEEVVIHTNYLAMYLQQLRARFRLDPDLPERFGQGEEGVLNYIANQEIPETMEEAGANEEASAIIRNRWMEVKAHLMRSELFWDRIIKMTDEGTLPRDMLRDGGWRARALNFANLAEPFATTIGRAVLGDNFKRKRIYKWAEKER